MSAADIERAERQAARVAAYVEGLRALADLIEATPELAGNYPTITHLTIADGAEDLARLASLLGGDRHKRPSERYMGITRDISGGVAIEVYAPREEVCERRVVGFRTEMVPDPDAPLVERTVEVVEWECAPVLGGAS